jgi:hypothetical protein
MTTEQEKKIKEKAKIKNDGVYTFQGIYYAIKNNKLKAWIYESGIAFCDLGGVNACVGVNIPQKKRRLELIKYLKRDTE